MLLDYISGKVVSMALGWRVGIWKKHFVLVLLCHLNIVSVLNSVRVGVLGCIWLNGWQCFWFLVLFVNVIATYFRRNYLDVKSLAWAKMLWLKQICAGRRLLPPTSIPKGLKHCCLVSQPFVKGRSGIVLCHVLIHRTWLRRFLSWAQSCWPGLSLYKHVVDFESLLCVRCKFSL